RGRLVRVGLVVGRRVVVGAGRRIGRRGADRRTGDAGGAIAGIARGHDGAVVTAVIAPVIAVAARRTAIGGGATGTANRGGAHRTAIGRTAIGAVLGAPSESVGR